MATELKREDGSNFVAGDDADINATVESVPDGITIVKAWITFKVRRTDADFIVQKILTSGFTGTTNVAFTFLLSSSDTSNFTPGKKYLFDVQIKNSAGKLGTPISDGEATFDQQTTTETS